MYANQEKIEAILGRSLTTDEVSLLDDIGGSIDSLIESYTNRHWGEVSETSRLYDGNGSKELHIDDFIELTKIELLDGYGTVYLTLDDEEDDWLTYPLNDTPKNSIHLRHYRFPRGNSRAKITAQFTSGETIPSEVALTASQLAAMFYQNNEIDKGFKRESIEGYSRELWDAVQADEKKKNIISGLEQLRKITF